MLCATALPKWASKLRFFCDSFQAVLLRFLKKLLYIIQTSILSRTVQGCVSGGCYYNLAAYDATYYHKFGHSKWHMAWETWYQYMKDTPIRRTSITPPALRRRGRASSISPANWSQGRPGRYEYFDDIVGQRTGFRTAYNAYLLSWNHWLGTTLVFRPELRYEAAKNNMTLSASYRNSAGLLFNIDGFSHALRSLCGYCHAGDVCAGTAEHLVHTGFCRLLRLGIGVRLPSGRVAVRSGRGRLVNRSRKTLVARTERQARV